MWKKESVKAEYNNNKAALISSLIADRFGAKELAPPGSVSSPQQDNPATKRFKIKKIE